MIRSLVLKRFRHYFKMPTWRTLTQKNKFALIHFDVDDTFLVTDTKKLISDNSTLAIDSIVKIKLGGQTYQAKVIALNGK